MNTQEFLERSSDFEDLIDLCNEYGCDIVEDVVSDSEMNSEIDDDIASFLLYNYWYDLIEILANINRDYRWYIKRDELEYDYLTDDDFEVYRDDVLEWFIDNGFVEDEKDDDFEESCDTIHSEDGGNIDALEEISILDLISEC